MHHECRLQLFLLRPLHATAKRIKGREGQLAFHLLDFGFRNTLVNMNKAVCCCIFGLLAVMAQLGIAMAVIKPPVPLKDLNPIDACLFACNMCYKREMVRQCFEPASVSKKLITILKITSQWRTIKPRNNKLTNDYLKGCETGYHAVGMLDI
ncbi:hypothetical protein CAPTEDRAFT_226109 [Capitella teleta]|uniref:Uncharacterized protein n=1 Tax=Capitella teleta TaxID=283909 RepID=R7T683_CAPTE|nr:hypothetical protein CAPTEDRAFT_226109 [Capitella teleta]|eukprot:ELT88763.1 hypothetical protein CAPTEDRAFT_226109 [Capitella teleta]